MQVTSTTTVSATETASLIPLTVGRARSLSPPSWLDGIPTDSICQACNMAWPPPPRTFTMFSTTTFYGSRTLVVTADALTTTQTITVTPPANILIEVQTKTTTITETDILIPLITVGVFPTFSTFKNNMDINLDNIHLNFNISRNCNLNS